MTDKDFVIERARSFGPSGAPRPTMLAIAGDCAVGKTTIARGLVEALGRERITSICVDDYHRYDREERRSLGLTPLDPQCNYVEVMEQDLQHLARGEPILKPTYNHRDGTIGRPELVEPRPFIIVEGLLALHTSVMRSCFDVTAYIDPPEPLRRKWMVERDCTRRGYTEEEVLEEIRQREPDSETFIRPQRSAADIVVRFAPIEERGETLDDPLSALLLLRPTVHHPDLRHVVTDDVRAAVHLKLTRDEDGKPVDALHIHAYADRNLTADVEHAIWSCLDVPDRLPPVLGMFEDGHRDPPLALTQLILLYHLIAARNALRPPVAGARSRRWR